MTSGRPAPSRFSVALHWLVAASVICQLALGFWLSTLPKGPEKGEWVQMHKSIGLIVFALALVRIAWRMRVGFPVALTAGWERHAARLSHLALLGATIVMPVSGVVRSLAYARPVSVFGWPVVPQLLAEKNEGLYAVVAATHDVSAWALIALLALHATAALKHHFVDRDDTLSRMRLLGTPGPRRSAR